MPAVSNNIFANMRYDLPAALVVFLVALPLCLGIALASGAPLFSGLIAGIVGGVVIGAISKSPLSVSGPAAGLTVIVFAAIQELQSFEAFLLAVCLAGVIQIALGAMRAGVLGDFIPSSVITGMLAAIGLILIMKQIPHALGWDGDFFGDEAFAQLDGENTLTALAHIGRHLMPGACIIALVSVPFLFWWDKKQPKFKSALRYVPGPLIVVLYGVLANMLFVRYLPGFAIPESNMVAVPVARSAREFFGQFSLPDFGLITTPAIWTTALTLALVASVETLLSIEAVDKLDPFRRVTPTNRELVAQGVGNIASGLIGGLPVTSVIVRSSANVSSGARTKMSAIAHGLLLLLSILAIPSLLNFIPLAALAAVLISVGFKLTKPAIYLAKYSSGWPYFMPFVVTIVAILLTDLLVGVVIGVVVGSVFVLAQNFRSAIALEQVEKNYTIRFKKDLFFTHKHELKRTLAQLPDGSALLIDFSNLSYIDKDNIEIINDFIVNAGYRTITVTLQHNDALHTRELMKAAA
jgi:MFS superfamily sulfate permease-like transporter